MEFVEMFKAPIKMLHPVISFGSKKDLETERKHADFLERMVARGCTEHQARRLVEWYMRVNKAGWTREPPVRSGGHEFTLSKEEFLDMFFEDLELPESRWLVSRVRLRCGRTPRQSSVGAQPAAVKSLPLAAIGCVNLYFHSLLSG